MVPAIVLSSHTMGLGVIRGIGKMGVPIVVLYYEKKDMGYVSKYVVESLFVPHPEINEKDFIQVLLKKTPSLQGGVLIPADDATLKAVSKNKDILERYYKVACPSWDVVEKCVDKKYTYSLAQQIGLPIPRTEVPQSYEEAKKFSESVTYPCLVKHCESHIYFARFGKKMVKVSNRISLLQHYQEAAAENIYVMLQEYIPGDYPGVNYNSFCWNGAPIVELTAVKLRMSPPEFGVPRVVQAIDIPEICPLGRNILNALGYNGYSCAEFKKDPRDGLFKFMEINARHNRSGLLSVACGVNMPYLEYIFLTQGKTVENKNAQSGIYWIDEVSDFINTIRYVRREHHSFLEYVRPYFSNHIFAVFDMKDLKPFIKRVVDIIVMAFRQGGRLWYSVLSVTLLRRRRNEK